MSSCDRTAWVEGAWILVSGSALLFSTLFGMLKGYSIYYFLPNERLQDT